MLRMDEDAKGASNGGMWYRMAIGEEYAIVESIEEQGDAPERGMLKVRAIAYSNDVLDELITNRVHEVPFSSLNLLKKRKL